MKITAQDIKTVLEAIALVIASIASCISAWRGMANGAKLAQVSAKVDAVHSEVKTRGNS